MDHVVDKPTRNFQSRSFLTVTEVIPQEQRIKHKSFKAKASQSPGAVWASTQSISPPMDGSHVSSQVMLQKDWIHSLIPMKKNENG